MGRRFLCSSCNCKVDEESRARPCMASKNDDSLTDEEWRQRVIESVADE